MLTNPNLVACRRKLNYCHISLIQLSNMLHLTELGFIFKRNEQIILKKGEKKNQNAQQKINNEAQI